MSERNKMQDTIAGWIYKLWDLKEGGVRLQEYKQLNHFTSLPLADQKDAIRKKLGSLVDHAINTTPFYSERYKNIDPDAKDYRKLLSSLPITSKQDIKKFGDDFISNSYEKTQLVRAKTGGSTGKSLDLYFSADCQKLRNGAQIYADTFANWRPGAKMAAVWGNPPVPTTVKQKLKSLILERTVYLDTMDISSSSVLTFVKKWEIFKPRVLFGHAHSIYILACHLRDKNIHHLRPAGIICTSMMLLDHERKIIEEAFGCIVTNRYGCEEVGLIAVECEQHRGMHINNAHIIVETLDEAGTPVPPGLPGNIVITDLNNLAMPLIRYKVEDIGVLSHRKCPCGRNSPMLEKIEGRVADFLKTSAGSSVSGISLVERTLTKFPGIAQMQLVQESLDSIIVNRVKSAHFSNDTDLAIIDELTSIFGPSTKIKIIDRLNIPQEKSGKYRFSICRV